MTAKTMAEVLAEHGEWRYTNGAGSTIVCRKCGAPVENVVEHQAAALSAAGFGLVADAKAEALEEAAAIFAGRLPDGTGNGRAYNSYQVANMLRARAAALRGES